MKQFVKIWYIYAIDYYSLSCGTFLLCRMFVYLDVDIIKSKIFQNNGFNEVPFFISISYQVRM